MACPSGSRTVTAFRNPALLSGSSTASVETKADRLFRRVCVASSTLIPKNLVCQWIRSLDFSSGGKGRPSRGARYSRNSIPGPEAARTAVMCRRAPENIVEPLLLRTVILTLSCYFHPEPVPIEFQTRLRFRNDDSSVIYSQKQIVRGDVPLRIALVGRKPEDFQRMTVRISEIECAD